jgi:prepilin-type N-terminal cleavage/methylation domain-containing protein
MNINKNKSGFTLLEIIIVIIIIGVLASLALPRFLNTVQQTYIGEAWRSISSIRGAIERCNYTQNNYTNCTSFNNQLDIDDPANEAGANFTYAVAPSATGYTITATRNTNNGGVAANTVSLIVDESTTPGTVTRSGAGLWANVN